MTTEGYATSALVGNGVEAHGRIIHEWYCAECGRAIPIEDERNEARD